MVGVTSVRLPDEDLELLELIAESEKSTTSAELREAVKLLVEAKSQQPDILARIQRTIEERERRLSELRSALNHVANGSQVT